MTESSEQEASIPDGWAAGFPNVGGETCWHIEEACPNCGDGPLGSNGEWKWCSRCGIYTEVEDDG